MQGLYGGRAETPWLVSASDLAEASTKNVRGLVRICIARLYPRVHMAGRLPVRGDLAHILGGVSGVTLHKWQITTNSQKHR